MCLFLNIQLSVSQRKGPCVATVIVIASMALCPKSLTRESMELGRNLDYVGKWPLYYDNALSMIYVLNHTVSKQQEVFPII